MLTRVRRGLALVAMVAASACTLLVHTDDLANDSAPRPDGGGTDAASDAAPPAEASDGDADAGPFCASRSPAPRYCKDFDDGQPFPAASLTIDPPGAQGSGVVDSKRAVSGTSALLISTVKGPDAYPGAYAFFDIGAAGEIRIEADVYVEQLETASTDGCRFLGVVAGNKGSVVMLAMYPDGRIIVSEEWRAGTVMRKERPAHTVPIANQWLHATMTVNLTTKALSATVNGMEMSDGNPLAGPVVPGSAAGVYGLYYADVTDKGWSIRYDNVVIDGR